MKTNRKTFTYLNHKFQSFGLLPKNVDFSTVTRQCQSIGISSYQGGEYSHAEFYRRAGIINATEIDIFLMDNEIIALPCENELFEYLGEFEDVS